MSERDWSDGRIDCICIGCDLPFKGHRNSRLCKACAGYSTLSSQPLPSTGTTPELSKGGDEPCDSQPESLEAVARATVEGLPDEFQLGEWEIDELERAILTALQEAGKELADKISKLTTERAGWKHSSESWEELYGNAAAAPYLAKLAEVERERDEALRGVSAKFLDTITRRDEAREIIRHIAEDNLCDNDGQGCRCEWTAQQFILKDSNEHTS